METPYKMGNLMNANEQKNKKKTKQRVITNYFTKVIDVRGASSEIVTKLLSAYLNHTGRST